MEEKGSSFLQNRYYHPNESERGRSYEKFYHDYIYLQSMLTPEEVQRGVKLIGYEDKARKFTVYHLLQYWCMAALEQWGSYRSIGFHITESVQLLNFMSLYEQKMGNPFRGSK
ncbi:hypothetical protein [Paenibacillus sp. MZ03-122A]|uniref:hypothetical protein n=1 Tax=Paenibacillus sp. MZ03-122A TaxID=2962033 RepID=UPI0020B7E78A|nr:hypothetical protein [Paenibacillus sp. MZ03-122A]MCP3779644.1 hypothetical protein [Paenibacillus sp. MZ03-122A]